MTPNENWPGRTFWERIQKDAYKCIQTTERRYKQTSREQRYKCNKEVNLR